MSKLLLILLKNSYFSQLPKYISVLRVLSEKTFSDLSEYSSYSFSIQLSNIIVLVIRQDVVEMRRIELLTPCLQGRCSPS